MAKGARSVGGRIGVGGRSVGWEPGGEWGAGLEWDLGVTGGELVGKYLGGVTSGVACQCTAVTTSKTGIFARKPAGELTAKENSG